VYTYMYKSESFSKGFKTNGAAQNNSNKRKFYIKNINPNVKLTASELNCSCIWRIVLQRSDIIKRT